MTKNDLHHLIVTFERLRHNEHVSDEAIATARSILHREAVSLARRGRPRRCESLHMHPDDVPEIELT